VNRVTQLPEIEIQVEGIRSFSFTPRPVDEESALDTAEAVTAGIFVYTSGVLPPQTANADAIVKANGFSFSVPQPRNIQLQARQSDNVDYGWSDQFALQIIETGMDFIRFRVMRLDAGSGPVGWGQSLRVDFLVIDDGTEF
jgi:hypothetical protein